MRAKAVYEELNGEIAVFIVDGISKIYHIPVSNLPADANLRDVYEVEVQGAELHLIKKLPGERETRLEANRLKRAELLKRRKSNN